jgi:hypothetical protein
MSKVTDRHTAVDYAHTLKDLSDSHFPDVRKIILVQDNSRGKFFASETGVEPEDDRGSNSPP